MPWNSTWPDGNVPVNANEITGQENTNYIKSTMGGDVVGTNAVGTRDHFWHVNSTIDGFHRFAKMPGFTAGGSAADPVIDTTNIQGVYYVKQKSSTESTFQQDFQSFFRSAAGASTNILQLLGIRAMGVFNGSSSTPTQANVVYSHNLKVQDAVTLSNSGIFRDGEGKYTITFQNALPSANYLVLGGGIRNSGSSSVGLQTLDFLVSSNSTLSNVKTTTFIKCNFQAFSATSGSPSPHDPLQGWFVVFGG